MHKRIFHNNTTRVVPRTSDGVVKSLPVDQFNVRDFNLNKYGWPKSDITLLVEVTQSKSFDVDRYNAFASRIHMLRAEPKNNKSVEQLIHEWRPNWMQTVTEEQTFREYYYNEFEKSPETPVNDSNPVENESTE